MNDGLRSGDIVQVKSAPEIAATLSPEGTLDHLPFMPEMLEYCGRRFRVLRRAEKTCIEIAPTIYQFGEFHGNDVVILEGLRCSGTAHDGCGRACILFWKSAWLSKVETLDAPIGIDRARHEPLPLQLKTKKGTDRYLCQSTELSKSTCQMSRARKLLKCVYEVRSGSRGLFETVWRVLRALWSKPFYDRRFPRLEGPLTRTPLGTLQLQPGEMVRIKPFNDILQTLDRNGLNRGLRCDLGMCKYVGRTYRVRNRLDRMIIEGTGEIRQVQGTVILENLECHCLTAVGGCPRQDFMYWREVWLERVEPSSPVCEEQRIWMEKGAVR
jgi:hypothetical protein